ncbi:hypothetical protein M404DRAFT_32857 [Pisolithus tinctorius Marx 270]|uniref:Uncharacterized protein n=1 Tax=Pisolithus tinctorius Marx 270 TaxID=870435 RepID=A0A0C3N6Z0_PISTI|nr:hypothetical protein M404DRAFT_32857 [Pisolithus tinctorius Marx 270]
MTPKSPALVTLIPHPDISPPQPQPVHQSTRVRVQTEVGRAFTESLQDMQECLAVDSPLSTLTELLDSDSPNSPPDTLVGPLSSTIIDLVISEHAHLVIQSDTCHDPADPSYDLSIPPATYDEGSHLLSDPMALYLHH